MKKQLKRTLSIFLCLVLMLTYLPSLTLAAADGDTRILNIVEGSKKADAVTIENWKDFFGPDKMDTENAGTVWTDKSVFTEESNLLPGVTMDDDKNFLVALSALSSTMAIKGYESAPTDVMIILDVSGSMVNTEMVVGYERDRDEVKGRDMSEVTAMVDATNATIKRLMEQNGNNRVGVVLFSGNSTTSEVGKTSHAVVALPLNRYTATNDKFLEINTTWTTATLYDQNGRNGQQKSYVKTSANVYVRTVSGVRVENGSSVSQVTKQVVGGTYTQNALDKAMDQFLAVEDTTVPAGRPQAGAERQPVLVLMTDGSPTLATPSYSNIGDSSVGNGQEPPSRTGLTNNQKTQLTDSLAFLTQLTAAHVRRQVTEHYRENAQDNEDFLFLTLGLGTDNMNAATQTLDPRNSSNVVKGYWDSFLAKNTGGSISITTGANGSKTVTRRAGITADDELYVDSYYYADDAQALIDSFEEIFKEIVLKSSTYATLVESNANYSGYITFEDEIGELMHVTDMKGVIMDDGKGGTVLYTGRGVAEGTANGQLGTAGGFTERGQEYIDTICERIPGINLSQAQALILLAMQDQQLYYEDPDTWSNYIGWYADEDGKYVGFWDKDSGYENAPTGAHYANKSYAYLGVKGDSDMMHVIVMVQTNLTTLHQTVKMRIPAALLPAVRYEVEIDENDPDKVVSFERKDAVPMRLVFEVGLRPDINSVNMEDKIAEHLQRGGHVHRLPDGTVELFTNSWAIGNDKNGNGYPDPDEVETAVVAESHFQPAKDNSHFYYLENTPVLDKNGNVITGSTRPTTGYREHYIYNETRRTTGLDAIAADNLLKAVYDSISNSWYIPAGTMVLEHKRLYREKDENVTETLYYHDMPAVFENGDRQDAYAFLGNNGTFRVAPTSGIVLEKKVEGGLTESTFTFEVSLSNVPQGVTADPVVTDANGDPLSGVTMSAYRGGKFTVTLPADVKAYISGIPAGTTVQVAEQIDGDYKVSAIQVAGQNQPVPGPATAIIPAYSPNGDQMVPVTFTNAPNGYGDLLVSKDVLHNMPSAPDALQDKVFTLNITLTGEQVEAGDTFDTSLNKKVKVGANGALTFENGDPITLRDAASLTILDLPEGTGYTVSESNIPDGFVLNTINGQAVTSVGGTIVADNVETVAVVNRYDTDFDPVQADMTVTVNKDLTGTPATPETFRFVLERLNANGGYDPEQTFSIRSDAANKVDAATLHLSFDAMGEYAYRIMEQVPDNPTPGLTYATTQSLFTIVVTDADMDGKLEMAVREEANVSAKAVYTDANNTETVERVEVEATFANRYAVHSTNVSIPVQKVLENESGVDIPLTEFKFGLYAADANNRPVGAPIQTVTADTLGQATFNLHITEDKDLTYIIQEIVPANKRVGMTYDDTLYLVEVDVSVGQGDRLMAVATTTPVGANTPAAVTFTNTYAVTPAEAFVPFVKQFSGRDLTPNELFRFELVRTDSAYQQLTGADAYTAYYFKGADALGITTMIKFGDKTKADSMLNKVGTYYFKLTEVDGGLPGITYDTSEYHIQIQVTDDGEGALAATTTIYKLGQADPVNTAAFVNKYTVTGRETLTFQGVKRMTGRVPNPNEFEVGLYSDAACTDLLDTATVRADGSFTFAFTPITYTPDHLGDNNAQKVYTYYVKEIDTDRPGVTYDSTVHTTTVTVDHEGGRLVVVPSDNTDSLVVSNRYDAKPTTITIPGRKALSGDWSAVQDKTFTFQLFETNSRFVITNQQPVATATVDGAATFAMTLDYEDGDEGTHYYLLREDLSQMRPGINSDAGSYHVTIEVTDPAEGQMMARISSMVRSGVATPVNEALFTNEYSVQPTSLTLEGSKVFTDLSTRQAKAMADGRFAFVVKENGQQVAEGKSQADGTIAFESIPYTAPGTHTYTVEEVNPGADDGVSYDNTVFTVTVTVTDNGGGTLTATPNYGTAALVFENFYNPDPVTYDLTAKKVYEGATLTADKFTFTLSGDTIATQEKKNDADGNVVFDRLTFEKTGTYTFTVEESRNLLWGFIQWDTNVYTVTVVVTDDEMGNLVIAPDAVTITSVKGRDDLTFVNVYTVDGREQVTIRGEKTLNGRDLTAGEFKVGLYSDAACTDRLDTADVLADGTFAFNPIVFTEQHLGAGNTQKVYTYYVKEIDNNLPGVTYDTTVHTVTVTVNHEDGALVVAASQNAANIRVANTYDAAPVSVSIPGRKALSGDWSAVQNQQFTFHLYGADGQFAVTDNQPVTTATVDGAATFAMTLDYEDGDEGTYYYVLEEDQANPRPGIAYDTVRYYVTVVVTDPGDGQLTAQRTLVRSDATNTPVNEALFTNEYSVQPTSLTLEGSKVFTDLSTRQAKTMADGRFTFVVKENGQQVAEGKSQADGTIAFESIPYTAPGTHTYTVEEVNPGADDGVSYDNTVFTVTVTVTDNGDGTLTAVADYNNHPIVFRNFYNPAPVTYTITAKKEYPGGTLEADQFTFTLTGDDSATQTKKNDANGNVVFEDLTFTKTGTYTYTVKETVDLLWDAVAWDTNEYTVTILVTDDQMGNLVIAPDAVTITSTKGRDDLTFVNVHKEGALEKDVFAPSAPTVSIDGARVEVGSEMLYAVTYHNRNGAAVDVTITDVIPEHTTYVDGSADNGGVYADGTLTWTAHVEMGDSITVTFRVTVDDHDVTILNQATALDGYNSLISNEVVNTTPVEEIPEDPENPEDPDTPDQEEEAPQTGDTSHLWLWLCLLLIGGGGMTVFGLADRRVHKGKH